MENRVSKVENAHDSVSVPMLALPPAEGSRTYPEDTKQGFKLFEPLMIHASAVAVAPLRASVQPHDGSHEDMASYTPVYRKVSIACRVLLIVAAALFVIGLVAVGIYFVAQNYVPNDMTVHYIDYFDDGNVHTPT